MQRAGTLFILVGPSGAGKNTLMQRVQQRLGDLPQLATMTTRAMRPGEKEGREHFFVTHDQFQTHIDQGDLIEYQQVHMDDMYGTPRATVEDAINANRDLIADIEFLGAGKIHEAYPANTVLIFVATSQLGTLAERIRQRGNVTPDVLQNRLQRARFEMTFAPQSHYLVLNDTLETAAAQLEAIITGERASRRGMATGHTTHTINSRLIALTCSGENLLVREITQALPAFELVDPAQPQCDALEAALETLLQQDVRLDVRADERFDFTAPAAVTIAARFPQVNLDYYYRCTLPEGAAPPEGWQWQPIASLKLPDELYEVLS